MSPDSTGWHAAVERWAGHVRVLAGEIGPRGPTTAAERRALEYCARVLQSCRLRVATDGFSSARSVFQPHLVAAIGILVAYLLYPLALPGTGLAAAALVASVMVCEIMELTLRPNPLQFCLPRAWSGNTFAVVEPAGAAMQDLVLIGHVDSQRTPRIFSSPRWSLAYRIYSTVAFASFVILIFLYALGTIFHWPWAWPLSGIAAVLAVLLVALCGEAERSPFTAGANDNATGAGLVLTLAEELATRPLVRTRVWCLCSGCEEALHEGAKAFFAAHRHEMTNPRAVAFEMLGCSGPAWLVREGIVLPLYSDPHLRSLAAAVARQHPDLGAYPASISGGVTEMTDALLSGVPAITVIGLTREGRAPYWHTPADTVDKLDFDVMTRNYRFVRALLEAIDAQGPGRVQKDQPSSPA